MEAAAEFPPAAQNGNGNEEVDEEPKEEEYCGPLGKIVQMTVENFKSYRGAQVIGPFHDFTAIIGPNGSGKSNLMDAVSFVLGVRTAQLRGNLRDLLYNNTDLGDSFERPRRGAVKLLFQPDKGPMVEFSRHIVPSGGENFSSQYRIDGGNVGWDAYNEKLKTFGILVKARNFLVFQGDIESVAGMQPADLTNLVEQIAGTDGMRVEYEQLELEKQAAEEKTSYVFSKKKSISSEKRQMKEQKNEAEKHLQMQEELTAMKTEYYLWKLFHAEQDVAKLQRDLETQEVELEAKAEAVAGVETTVKEKRQEQAGLSKQRVVLEKKVAQKRTEIDDQRPELIQVQGEIERVSRRVQKGKRDLEVCEKETERQQTAISKLQEDHSSVEAAIAEHKANKDTQGSVKLTPEQREEFNQLEGRAGAAAFKLSQERDDLKTAQKTDEADHDALKKAVAQTQSRLKNQSKELEMAKEQQEHLRGRLAEEHDSIQAKRAERRKLSEQMRSCGSEREKLDQKLQAVEGKLREARADRRDNERERKMKEAITNMKQIFSGVHGRLTDLAEVTNRKYNMALSVLLGRHMDSVVVDTDKTARDCIQYLKEHRIFAMTFIPLQNLKVSPINERLRQMGGTVKLALDVVQFSPQVERAFVHVLENSLVCDSLDEARRLGYHSGEKLKVCACDGTLINRNGNITGGGSSSMEDRARRWDQKGVDEMKKEREELQAAMKELPDVREVRSKEQFLTAEVSGLEQRTKIKESEITRLQAKQEKLEADVSRLQGTLQQQEPRVEELGRDIDARAEKLKQLEDEIGAIHNKFFLEFSERLGIPNIHEYMEAYDRQIAEYKQAEARLKAQLAKVKAQLDFVRKQEGDQERKSQSIKGSIANDEASIEQHKSREEEIQQKSAALEDEILAEQEEIQKLQAQMDANEEDLATIQKEASEQLASVNKLRRSIASKQSQLEQLAIAREDILESASIDQITIPLLRQEGEDTEMAEAGAPQQAAAAEPAGDADGEAGDVAEAAPPPPPPRPSGPVDFSGLKRAHAVPMRSSERESLDEEFKSSINELTAHLERNVPNMRALEQYGQIKEKERQHMDELDAAKAEAKAATEAFNNLRARRHQLFTAAFDHISTSIDPIYKELTKSAHHVLGGTAYLSLENPDEPFLHGIKYTAMPPSKRFRDMEQLSGGEKTIAALSLLFAIHSFKPSPFFVLDECDAALDSTNVARIAAFVRTRSRRTARHSCQSIVISLKDIFYEQADALVGVSKDLKKGSSTTYTLDLNQFG